MFVAGQGLSNIGTFSQMVALSLLVLHLTDSGLALGVVMAAQALPMVVLAPWAGSVLDRGPVRRVLFVTALLGAVQVACLAALALTGTINLAWVFGLAIGLGCIQVFDRPGGLAFIAELVPREAIAGAVGLASSAQAIGRLGGPALGAVLYAWAGAGSVFAVNAAWPTAEDSLNASRAHHPPGDVHCRPNRPLLRFHAGRGRAHLVHFEDARARRCR